jgi:hypothetical protein
MKSSWGVQVGEAMVHKSPREFRAGPANGPPSTFGAHCGVLRPVPAVEAIPASASSSPGQSNPAAQHRAADPGVPAAKPLGTSS